MRPSRFWTGVKHAVAEGQTRSTSRRNGIDIQLWALDRYTRSGRLVDDLVPAVKAGHVCGSAADVEPRVSEIGDTTHPMIGARSSSSQLVRA